GYEGSTDVIVYGVPAEMVADEVVGPRGFSYADPATSAMPVLVSRYFIDLFNLGLAEGQGLPKLSDRAVVGRRFDLFLGRSLLQLDDRPDRAPKVPCEIVGLTQNPSLLGLVAPIEYVRRFNRWYHGAKADEKYVQVHVVLVSPEDRQTVAEHLETWGFQVEGERERGQRLRLLVNGAAVILLLFGLAVLAMAGVIIVNTFALIMQERRGEIGLLRAVGATRGEAMGLLLAESALVGLAGGIVGSGFASVAARVGNEALAQWLPSLPIAPDRWLYESVLLLAFCVALAAWGSALSAAPMLWRSVRRWPADLLRES
ncbi:FtsX-like permease family protein, partial [Candidatus Sumerlaeota bacterium]|nr:FtsX-like permease family protein [Candidatus Sumerlaeota bacterium]